MKQVCNTAIPRLEKAFKLIKNVVFLKHPEAVVYSDGKKYKVDYITEDCKCEDHVYRGLKCKHIWAVQLNIKMQMGELKHV